MATTTSNLGLIKPERSDNYSVGVMSNNMDIIDTKIAVLEAGKFDTIEANNIVGNIDVSNSLLYVPYPEVPSLARILWESIQYKNGVSTSQSISATNSKFVPTTGIFCKTLTIEASCHGIGNAGSYFGVTLYGTKDGVETVLKSVNGSGAISINLSIEEYLSYSSFRFYITDISGEGVMVGNCNFVIRVKSFIM